MAWRRGERLAHGIGQGIESLGTHLLRQRTQDRYDQRQQDNAKAILDRQQKMSDKAAVLKVIEAVAKGDQDPAAAISFITALTGEAPDPAMLESVRPSARRRMEATGTSIDSAAKLTDVPTDESIRSVGRSKDLFDPAFVGPMPEGEESFAGFDQAVRETGARAGARRRAFMDSPTEKVTGRDPQTNAPFTVMKSLTDLQTPFVTGPTAQQEGALEGQKETALLGAVGDARASQVGKETTARNQAETTPQAIAGAAAKARAERTAQLQAELSQYGITGQQQTAAMQLADDFFTQSKDYYVKANSVKNIASMAQRIREARNRGEDSPASHIGLVFNFMKLQDPTSTVREGEQAQAANAGGVEDRVRNLYNKILLGGRLSDEQVNDFLGTAAAQYQAELGDQRARIQTFTERANTLRVPASLVVREPDPSLLNIGLSAADRLRERGGQ